MTCHKGIWVDESPKKVCKPEFWDNLQSLGFNTAALFVSTLQVEWEPRYELRQIDTATRLAIGRDIEVVLTCCPSPRALDLSSMSVYMAEALACGAYAVEVDLEGQWRERHVQGYEDIDEASVVLLEKLLALSETFHARVEVTTHTGHLEHKDSAQVSPYVHRYVPQLYSTRHDWKKREVDWDSPMGPGNRQRVGIAQAQRVSDKPLCIGLAAWDQCWPGRSVHAAMESAVDAAMLCEPAELRYWSSKWLKNRRVREFLGGLKL